MEVDIEYKACDKPPLKRIETPSHKLFFCITSILHITCHTSSQELSRTQFASHVSVNTPASSFTHGVGDPVNVVERRSHQRRPQSNFRGTRRPISLQGHGAGYTRQKPLVPFRAEEVARDRPLTVPWPYNFMDYSIPVLPPSPYKVDSPDPESLWPTGLFLPPLPSHPFGSSLRRLDSTKDADTNDPYLLEGSEAVAAVLKSRRHGLLYFHDIPHIQSLLDNQEVRIENNLEPHRLGSIRHTWPYYRT